MSETNESLIFEKSWSVSLPDLQKYAWASGDINPIHFSESSAKELGLETIIVHGLFAQSVVTSEIIKVCEGQKLGTLKSSHTKFSSMMPCPGTYAIQVLKVDHQAPKLIGRVKNAQDQICVEVQATIG